jgi:hypothetical protein
VRTSPVRGGGGTWHCPALPWILLSHSGEETLLQPADKLLTRDSVVIVGRSDVVHAHLVENECTAVVQLGQDVARLCAGYLQQAILGHGMHDDDALALVVATNLVLSGRRETVLEELRAVVCVDIAFVHEHDDGRTVLLLLQRRSILVDVATNERPSVGRSTVDEMLPAVLVAQRMQPTAHRTLRHDDAQFCCECGAKRVARLEGVLQRHFVQVAVEKQLRGEGRAAVTEVEGMQRIGAADGRTR